MKALEKDRNRRYDTASSFAGDVQRYLHDEPVEACPPSAVYRLRKFARRNKVLLTTATTFACGVLLAVAGLVVSTVLVWRANTGLSDAFERERQNSYFQRVSLAEREWSTNKLTRVEELLDGCPADLRDWEWHYVKRLRLQGLSPLRHPTAVFSAVFSPDGRWIVSASQDGRVTVWNATTGQQLFWFQAHERDIASVALSPDGRRVATASWDGTVKIWNFDPLHAADKHSLFQTLPGHTDGVQSVAFSPDNQHLASGGRDKTVRVWEVATASQIWSSRAHAKDVTCVTYSPDGQWIASASNDKSVKIWDAATGREKPSLTRHGAAVWSVSFSSDGRWLAAAGEDLNRVQLIPQHGFQAASVSVSG
jgi:WD40 repeat protein